MADPGENVQIIRSFCDAWSRRDAAEIVAYFTEDAVYHNIPMQPVCGHAAITAFIEQFLVQSSAVEFEIRSVAAVAETVMTERVDRFTTSERQIELPVAGVFELHEGKISAWRDYFDLQTWVKQARG